MASEWEETTLGDEVDLLTGFPFKSERYTDADDSIRLVRGDNIVQGALRWDGVKRWPASGSAEHELYQLREGDVVLAMDRPWIEAGLKYAAISKYDLPCFLVQRTARLRGSAKLENRFLRYLIGSQEFTQHIHAITTGTAVPHISGRQIKDFAFLLPPIAEQRAIAHILGTLDDKIELNRRMSETLEAMARVLFKSWFVDFDPVRAKAERRDPGLPKPLADLFPDSFEDSELGEIPEGWEVTKLGEIVNTVKGTSYRSDELAESDTALITLKSFARGGGYRADGLKSFSGAYKPAQVVALGEVVIACTDVTQAAEVIGRPAMARATNKFRTLVASLDTLIVRPREPEMTRSFLYFLAGTEEFAAHTYAYTIGTTVLHLSKDAVPSFRFACPPPELVKLFESTGSSVLGRLQAIDQESDVLANMRDALLPKLISGELRVARDQHD